MHKGMRTGACEWHQVVVLRYTACTKMLTTYYWYMTSLNTQRSSLLLQSGTMKQFHILQIV